MERRIITIHECLKMTPEELHEFIVNDEKLLNEGIGDRSQSNIDFCGLTIKDIAEQCGDVPADEVFNKLYTRFGGK